MAIFETGASTSLANFLDALATFCAANGWIVSQNGLEGSGRRVHLQLDSDVCINLRSYNAETGIPAFGTVPLTCIAMNGSTGYNAAQAWYNQPGYTYVQATAGKAFSVGVPCSSNSIPTYYFFARDSMIYVWVEISAGTYQWMVFGRIQKYGTWAGGTLIAASGTGIDNNIPNSARYNILGSPGGNIGSGLTPNINGFMYATVDGNTGWLNSGTTTTTNTPMPKVFDTITLEAVQLVNLSNIFNSQEVLIPVEICVTRDGTGNWVIGTTNFSVEGLLPDLYLCNTKLLVPGQQLDDGSGDIFRVLPFFQKGIGSGGAKEWAGVAIKEN
jgi:hypothetical protein